MGRKLRDPWKQRERAEFNESALASQVSTRPNAIFYLTLNLPVSSFTEHIECCQNWLIFVVHILSSIDGMNDINLCLTWQEMPC